MKMFLFFLVTYAFSFSTLAVELKNGIYKNPKLSCEYNVQLSEDKSVLYFQIVGNFIKCPGAGGSVVTKLSRVDNTDKYSKKFEVSQLNGAFCVSTLRCYHAAQNDVEVEAEWETINESAFTYRVKAISTTGESKTVGEFIFRKRFF